MRPKAFRVQVVGHYVNVKRSICVPKNRAQIRSGNSSFETASFRRQPVPEIDLYAPFSGTSALLVRTTAELNPMVYLKIMVHESGTTEIKNSIQLTFKVSFRGLLLHHL